MTVELAKTGDLLRISENLSSIRNMPPEAIGFYDEMQMLDPLSVLVTTIDLCYTPFHLVGKSRSLFEEDAEPLFSVKEIANHAPNNFSSGLITYFR
jgi:hypothetical protein